MWSFLSRVSVAKLMYLVVLCLLLAFSVFKILSLDNVNYLSSVTGLYDSFSKSRCSSTLNSFTPFTESRRVVLLVCPALKIICYMDGSLTPTVDWLKKHTILSKVQSWNKIVKWSPVPVSVITGIRILLSLESW